MKSTRFLFTIFLSFLPISFFVSFLFANELESPNFKMIGVSTGAGGGILESTSYSLLSHAGRISADPRIYSNSYRMHQDPSAIFTAAQPSVLCFETDTDGSTDCLTGPAELAGGMVALCGPGGCYDRARFEIEGYGNPSDTLYMIQISEDDFTSDIRCVDASTNKPKTLSSCDINDFRTKEGWEQPDFNLKGLDSGIEYYLRITAFHGDFTQSDFSIPATATTSMGYLEFDIDIAPDDGYTTKTNPPHTISFIGEEALLPGGVPVTSSSLIWLDLLSSSYGGVAIIQYGKNGGLYSPTTSETILSENEDISIPNSDGFGLQNYYVNFNGDSPYYGEITPTSNYTGTDYMVGEVSQDAKKIYEATGLIVDGRMALYLKARASSERTPSTDYSENIYFIAVPRY